MTRDRREAHGRLGDLDFTLIDTAGFEDATDASLEARMRAQTEIAIAEADVILFMIDARVGVTPVDEAFAALLRRADKPVVLVANKAEGRAGDVGRQRSATRLGMGEPIPLSAEHGEGMGDLYAAIARYAPSPRGRRPRSGRRDVPTLKRRTCRTPRTPCPLPAGGGRSAPDQYRHHRPPERRQVHAGQRAARRGSPAGRPRSRHHPRRHRHRLEWGGKSYRLVDTAGMRRKAKVQAKLEKLSVGETLHAIRFADVCVLVMDADEAFEKQDLAIADLVEREGRALVFVLAKWDQVEDPRAHLEEMKLVARESLPQARGAPIVTVAAQAGVGLDRLMKAVERRIATGPRGSRPRI